MHTTSTDTTVTSIVKVDNPINIVYMSKLKRRTTVFLYFPLFKHPKHYISWLEKVEKKKPKLYEKMGIYDLIQLSKVGPSYCQKNLVASLYFWESTSNTFHLPCGMVTRTLFDLVAIAGVRLTCEAFDPDVNDEDTINLDHTWETIGHYIEDHHNKASKEVSDARHIAFLAL